VELFYIFTWLFLDIMKVCAYTCMRVCVYIDILYRCICVKVKLFYIFIWLFFGCTKGMCV